MTAANTIRVSALDDPRVADYRNLKDAELRRRRGLFVVEGRRNVEILLRRGRYRPRSVFVTPAARAALRPCLCELPADVPVYVGEQAVLNDIVGVDLHRGCLAVALRGDEDELEDLVAASSATAPIVALEDLTDVENAGSVFRNALALGASGVLLSPRCCDPLYRKAVRVSMGAVLQLPHARSRDWAGDLRALRAAGHAIVALDPSAEAQEIGAFAGALRGSNERLVIVAGTEGEGLSPETKARADARVRIAMAPGVDSINVATALAIALHHLAEPGA